MAEKKSYVFCIGFNKTGTISLFTALKKTIGNGIHGMWWNHLKVQRALEEEKDLLTYFDETRVHFSDLDILKDHFQLLDAQYPGSKFLLHTRNKEDWLRSRTTHLERYHASVQNGATPYPWRWITETPEQWSREWDEHHARVRSYFAGRDDLLVIDVPGGDGYEQLCPFLGVPLVHEPFPRLNQTNASSSAS